MSSVASSTSPATASSLTPPSLFPSSSSPAPLPFSAEVNAAAPPVPLTAVAAESAHPAELKLSTPPLPSALPLTSSYPVAPLLHLLGAPVSNEASTEVVSFLPPPHPVLGLSSPTVTTSAAIVPSLLAALSPLLPATPVIADICVSSASLSSSLSSSSSPFSSEELSSASSSHSSGSSSASGSSTQSQQSAHRTRAVYAENAYVSLLRDIEALSSQVQPPSLLAVNVPPVLTVALSETVQKAQEGWKKITKLRKRTKKRVSRGIELALKKEGRGPLDGGQKGAIALKLSSVPNKPPLQAERKVDEGKRERALDGMAGGGVGGGGGAGGMGGVGGGAANGGGGLVAGSTAHATLSSKRALAAKRKSRGTPSTSADGGVGMGEVELDGDLEGEEDNSAVHGDDEDSDEKEKEGVALLSSAVAFTSPISPSGLGLSALPTVLSPSSAIAVAPTVYDSQAPVVMSCSKFPIAVLHVPVQRQYTMTRKDSKRIKREEKESLVNVSVRIMGTPDASFLYFVAKDVCQLICLRKGSVAKAIHDFTSLEKARMPVMCQRSSGSGCTQVLTVLTVAGVQRLMSASRQPVAKSVLQWIMEKIGEIQREKNAGASLSTGNTLGFTPPDPSHAQQRSPQQPRQLPGHRGGVSDVVSPSHHTSSHLPVLLDAIPRSSAGSSASAMTVTAPPNATPVPLHSHLTFPSDGADSFLQSAMSAPSRPGGVHSPTLHSFVAAGAPGFLAPQYLTSSNPLPPSYPSLHFNPFPSLQSFPSSFSALQSAPTTRSTASSSSYPSTPPFSSYATSPSSSSSSSSSSATLPSHHLQHLQQQQQKTAQALQAQNQQLIEALQAHSESLSMRYSPQTSSSSPHYAHPMAIYGALQQAGLMTPQPLLQPPQQHQPPPPQQQQPPYPLLPQHLMQPHPQQPSFSQRK